MNVLDSPTPLAIYHRGPSLEQKGLPALFYFTSTGSESLERDPFNQPIVFLKDSPIHCFSFTLPGHGKGIDNRHMMREWAKIISQGEPLLASFLQYSLTNIAYLIAEGWIDPTRMAVAGLSRGGLAAVHLAVADPRIQHILAFAPLTQLDILPEFQSLRDNPIVKTLRLASLVDKLASKKIRFYIGNRDMRVSTASCFQCVAAIAEAAYQQGIRSPQTELVISPSIGFQGHGTAPAVFAAGAQWIKTQLEQGS